MNLTERKRAARLQAARKALASGYALVNLVMAFFAAWTVYGAVRLCVGLSGEIYWPVSYTHLDVYKRQPVFLLWRSGGRNLRYP